MQILVYVLIGIIVVLGAVCGIEYAVFRHKLDKLTTANAGYKDIIDKATGASAAAEADYSRVAGQVQQLGQTLQDSNKQLGDTSGDISKQIDIAITTISAITKQVEALENSVHSNSSDSGAEHNGTDMGNNS